MKEIQLTRGKFTLVDDEDYEWLNQWKWHYTHYGYAARRSERHVIVLLHRLVLCAPKGSEVDHANGDRLDNRRVNLRFCTRSQNNANKRLTWGRSKYKGVWLQQPGRWVSEAKKDGVKHRMGTYDTEEDAARAYDEAAKKLFGEFARLNFPDDV